MTLLKMSLINLFLWCLDMATAIAGFHYGFGLDVKNWPALIGFMVLARWMVYVIRGCHDLSKTKKGAV